MFHRSLPKSFFCQDCNLCIEESINTTRTEKLDFNCIGDIPRNIPHYVEAPITVTYHRCPRCGKISLLIHSAGSKELPAFTLSYPPPQSVNLPEYIPIAIRNDYHEACLVADLSPKSAATLARRCLQGMIRDFWKIHEKTLNAEISALQGKIPDEQWNVLNGVRRIGNIGAHMEADVNTIIEIEADEAKRLLSLILFLFQEWYIQDHARKQLYADILEIDQNKAELRKAQSD